MISNEIVLDIETKNAFSRGEYGQFSLEGLGVSVVGVYTYQDDTFKAYGEDEFEGLEKLLETSSRIIGFNSNRFDLPVLQPHMQHLSLKTIPSLDLMDAVKKSLGFRMSLQNLVSTTLGKSKSGSGLDAIRWYKEGKIEKIKEYCLQDVRVTRDLYEYGKTYGNVYCKLHDGTKKGIPTDWTPKAKQLGLM